MTTENPASILFDAQGLPLGLTSDAFARLRTSSPSTIFDSKQVFDAAPLLFSTATATNGAIGAHDPDRASTTLTVTAEDGSRALRQSKRYFNYQPGKSQLVFMTFVVQTVVAGVTHNIGYFDDENGLMFRVDGVSPQVVRRSHVSGSAVEEVVDQADWNIDKLDGTGRSGITLDPSKALILVIDFEWLGVGIARIGFVIGGRVYYVHAFKHSNILTSVYMSTPNLPVRWEIESDGTNAGSLETICCSVISEGGVEPTGVIRSATTGITSKSADNSAIVPLIQLRAKDTYKSATVFMWELELIPLAKANSAWFMYLNATKNADGVGPSWASVVDSAMEFDITETNTISGGTLIASGHFSEVTQVKQQFQSLLLPGREYDGTRDILTLAVQSFGASSEDYAGSLTWLEAA